MNQLTTLVRTLSTVGCIVLNVSTLAVAASNPTSSAGSEFVIEVEPNPWVNTQGNLTQNVSQLVSQIQDSVYHGLNPENYRLTEITEIHRRLQSTNLSAKDRNEALKELRTTLDGAFYSLAKHLGSSVIEGRSVQKYIFLNSPKPNLDSLHYQVIGGELDINEAFHSIAPTHSDYTRLQDALRILLNEKSSGLERTKVAQHEKLIVGDTHEIVRSAKLRLRETGDLEGPSEIDNVFDESLKTAVKAFQLRHHVSPTGELNESTITHLNSTVDDEIAKVVVSLERWRWMPRDLGFQRVIANVPDYRLRMHNGEQKIVDIAVVVGKRRHKTPLFSETIKHVVAAPTWTVPASIANDELIPIERQSPGYLVENNYEFLKWTGRTFLKVPVENIPRSEFESGIFPYTIRQKPGDDNVLGRVKILMPNPYAIYFHDTQAKKLFSRERRAFSHGCVRLADPNRLASLLMQIDGVSRDEATDFLANTTTTTYDLKRPVDSHIIYMTTFVDEDGKLQFRDDVYRYDKKITKALNNNKTLLGITKREKSKTILADIDSIEL